jgi:anti-sigma B factor antagonist
MAEQPKNLIVVTVPGGGRRREQRSFLRGLASRMSENRPCIVLDCSRMAAMNRSKIHLLLCCLEEALKRNGDVRLAGIPPEAKAAFEVTGAFRLFQIFASNTDAIKSFNQPTADAPAREEKQGEADRRSQNAA